MRTGENAVDARSVEALGSVSTGENAVNARIAEALASVSTGDDAMNARIVEARASVSTGDDAIYAGIVVMVGSEKRPRWISGMQPRRKKWSHCAVRYWLRR